jgi:predicted Zn-dependent protease
MRPKLRLITTFLISSVLFLNLARSETMASLTCQQVDERLAQEPYKKGNSLLDERKYQEAVKEYEKAIALNPQWAEAYFNRAMAYERIDRKLGLKAWEEFISIAKDKVEMRSQVALVKYHLKNLASPRALPASLSMSNYSDTDGDYYDLIIMNSHGQQWSQFPLKVFIAQTSQKKAMEAVFEAIEEWNRYIPLKVVNSSEGPDIKIAWSLVDSSYFKAGTTVVGTEKIESETQKSEIEIALLEKEKRSKKELKAILLHELGHALGIKGHSNTEKDLMYTTRRDQKAMIGTKDGPKMVEKSIVNEITRRDANTLIRLYNTDTLLRRY